VKVCERACFLAFILIGLNSVQAQQLSLHAVLAQDEAIVSGQGVRAQLIAVQTAMLSAGLSARIERVPFSVGDYIEEGDILVQFDCNSIEAEKKIYESQQRAGQLNLEVKSRLRELNSVGNQELELTKVELDAATAQLEILNLRIEQCQVISPFSGRVVARNADPYEYVSVGSELVEVLASDNLEVMLVAPSSWLSWIQLGEPFSLVVEELKQTFSGTLIRLGGEVDPISQTVLVWGKLTDPNDRLLPGMSGDIRFTERE